MPDGNKLCTTWNLCTDNQMSNKGRIIMLKIKVKGQPRKVPTEETASCACPLLLSRLPFFFILRGEGEMYDLQSKDARSKVAKVPVNCT